MSRHLRPLAAAVAATVLLVGAGVALDLGAEPVEQSAAPPAPAAPTVSATPLAEVDTAAVTVLRQSFCGVVPPDEVERALGLAPAAATEYADGQPAQVTGTVRDVAHEFGCTWSAPRATARAWVFAPPVTAADATDLVAAARDEAGCSPAPGAPAYGVPSVVLLCNTERGLQVSFRGLFGDAWLACSLVTRLERPEALERTSRWCASVVQAASTLPPDAG